METRAFVEIVTYIESLVEKGNLFFELSGLHPHYEFQLKNFFGISKNKLTRFILRTNFFHIFLKPKLRVIEKKFVAVSERNAATFKAGMRY